MPKVVTTETCPDKPSSVRGCPGVLAYRTAITSGQHAVTTVELAVVAVPYERAEIHVFHSLDRQTLEYAFSEAVR